MTKEKLVDATWSIDENLDGLLIRKDQEITAEFLDGLKEDRLNSRNKAQDFHKAASIPTVVVEKWMREGFNIFDSNIKAEDILKRLRAEGLDAFIATEKRLY